MAAESTTMGAWLRQLLARAHPNIVVVALAAKLARIIWVVLHRGTSFDQSALVAV